MKFWMLIGFLTLLVSGCKRVEQADTKTGVGLFYPNYIPEPHYQFKNNPITSQGVEIGRLLFYDPILSRDSSISCGKCHAQVHAFADHGINLSTGIDGQLGTRNSPPIFNLAWMPNFMWDGGINHIEVMPLGPIMNPAEMDFNMKELVDRLNQHPKYRLLFRQAFGVLIITDDLVLKTLTQFMGTITSFESKYDQMRKGQYVFTSDESAGYKLFQRSCNSCHSEPLFTNYNFVNNGLDSVFKDYGRMLITQDARDKGKFKVPSLRNVYMTNPYMHDGRFQTLYDVMNHYRFGIKSSNTLHSSLEAGIELSDVESAQIIAFLKTLTDYSLLGNRAYSEP